LVTVSRWLLRKDEKIRIKISKKYRIGDVICVMQRRCVGRMHERRCDTASMAD
jgi:hypothetical protein